MGSQKLMEQDMIDGTMRKRGSSSDVTAREGRIATKIALTAVLLATWDNVDAASMMTKSEAAGSMSREAIWSAILAVAPESCRPWLRARPPPNSKRTPPIDAEKEGRQETPCPGASKMPGEVKKKTGGDQNRSCGGVALTWKIHQGRIWERGMM